MAQPRHSALYQLNTRAVVHELARALGRPATLDDVPDAELDRIAGLGFDWVWLLGVWQTGVASRAVSRTDPALRAAFERTLPDLREEDICGSCFAITGYHVHPDLGGDAALDRLRTRLHARGLRLMLDFVPNHTALDHPWVAEHPDYYVGGTEDDLTRAPGNYGRATLSPSLTRPEEGSPPVLPDPPGTARRELSPGATANRILAHGRDPYFPGWADTWQLDYGNPELHEAMVGELLHIAGQCDGVRCDMAMLLLPEVFARVWGITIAPFWPEAIARVRAQHPRFTFLAEVYWDLEWELQQQGFDYTYDKRLYDRLRDGPAAVVRAHLQADLAFQERSARFLENHDEPRAAATFPPGQHEAAAVATFFTPGLRFFHQGQLEGRRIFLPVHLCRAPAEPLDRALQEFYARLLAALRQPAVRAGAWRLLTCTPAWDGNWTADGFLAYAWELADQRLLVAVNYAPHAAQCYVRLPFGNLDGRSVRLADLMGPAVYHRDGSDLTTCGLYLDLPAWGHHVFQVMSA